MTHDVKYTSDLFRLDDIQLNCFLALDGGTWRVVTIVRQVMQLPTITLLLNAAMVNCTDVKSILSARDLLR